MVRDLHRGQVNGDAGDVLDQLGSAAELEALAHELVRVLVDEARACQLTWRAIARQLWRWRPGEGPVRGVTRQAAQARFTTR